MKSNSQAVTLRRFALACGILLMLALAALKAGTMRGHAAGKTQLTFEARLAAQRAIERVYWQHRLWPRENPQPKPPLDEAMPDAAIRAKVEDALRKSAALEAYWQRPVTPDQLQAEMERMARQTKQPEVLRELWAALGDDPTMIAECLARPALVERLLRNWYAFDQRQHGALKLRAEAELSAPDAFARRQSLSGEYRETEWRQAAPSDARPTTDSPQSLDAEQWRAQMDKLRQLLGAPQDSNVRSTADVRSTAFRRNGLVSEAQPPEDTVLGVKRLKRDSDQILCRI